MVSQSTTEGAIWSNRQHCCSSNLLVYLWDIGISAYILHVSFIYFRVCTICLYIYIVKDWRIRGSDQLKKAHLCPNLLMSDIFNPFFNIFSERPFRTTESNACSSGRAQIGTDQHSGFLQEIETGISRYPGSMRFCRVQRQLRVCQMAHSSNNLQQNTGTLPVLPFWGS